MATQSHTHQDRSNQTYLRVCKSFSYSNYHTPLQSPDCGACAPKTPTSVGVTMWSHSILEGHKKTNSLIIKEEA